MDNDKVVITDELLKNLEHKARRAHFDDLSFRLAVVPNGIEKSRDYGIFDRDGNCVAEIFEIIGQIGDTYLHQPAFANVDYVVSSTPKIVIALIDRIRELEGKS